MQAAANFGPTTFVPRGEDQELILRSATDDSHAFEALFARHRDGLHGYLYRKLHSHEEAEDAVTLTFCNAWRARASFRGNASGKAWLYQIGTRVALDMLRRRRRQPAEQTLDMTCPELLGPIGEETVDPAEVILDAERSASTRAAVNQALERLPDDERRLLTLFYFDGYNYEQISELLGVSRSQIRGRLHRIRARVRRDLVDRQCWHLS